MKTRRLAAGALSIALAVTMLSTTAFAASVKFTDVPSNHWAHASVVEMAEKGVVAGVGNNLFAPDTTVSYAQFATMIVRSFYNDQIGDAGEKWYSPYMTAAEKAGILDGTKVLGTDSLAEDGICRYEMAQVMYNVMKAKDVAVSSLSDTSKVSDWSTIPANYKDAVSVCYNMGMLSGVDSKGTFSGTTMMTRAQAAVVMSRLLEVCSGGMPSTPTVPEKPAGSLTLTGDNILYISGDGSKYENGVFHLYNSGFEGTGGYITFNNPGYSTLTFTVTVYEEEHVVDAGGIDGIDNVAAVKEDQDPETTKTYTADISGCKKIQIDIGSGYFCNAEVTNIYLS